MAESNQTLEQKLLRLQEIQKLLEGGSVNLTDSISLFEEANTLKAQIEVELNVIKNKITEIEARNNSSEDQDLNL
jgi:exodeoxyribonuclease VII small subunit